jgi:HSP20 family protein
MLRKYRYPGLWREMDRLQRDMNRMFDNSYITRTQTAPSYPALKVWADEESVLVTAEMPGVRVEDLDIHIEEGSITLSGERVQEDIPENVSFHRRERRYGKFSRSLSLPFRIDADKVDAILKNGVLTLTLPRAEEDKPRKLEIKTG